MSAEQVNELVSSFAEADAAAVPAIAAAIVAAIKAAGVKSLNTNGLATLLEVSCSPEHLSKLTARSWHNDKTISQSLNACLREDNDSQW